VVLAQDESGNRNDAPRVQGDARAIIAAATLHAPPRSTQIPKAAKLIFL
jgi:hypothetical protein